MNFDGIWTPVVTPFAKDGSVAAQQLTPLIDSLVEAEVSGLIVGGTTGEYYALSNEERKALFQSVVEANAGRLPLMAGINATTTNESIELGLHAKALGYGSILVAAPYYAQPTQDELLTHVQSVDDAIDLPVMLYNFPARTGTEMSFEFIDALKTRPNIQAIKESTGSIDRLHRLANDYGDQLQLGCGMDDQILEYFAWGARCWVGGASNFSAKQHVELYKTCVLESNLVEGRKLASKFLPMLHLLEQGGKFCQHVKYGCEIAGIPVGNTRKPLLPLTASEKAAFEKAFAALTA